MSPIINHESATQTASTAKPRESVYPTVVPVGVFEPNRGRTDPSTDGEPRMTDARLTASDEGKRVVNANGDKIGMLTEVRGETAYLDPDPGMTEKVKSMLDMTDADAGDFTISGTAIDTITDDEVRLRRGR